MVTYRWNAGLRVLVSIALLSTAHGETTPATGAQGRGASVLTSPANVTAARMSKAASEPSQWMTYGGTYDEQRFSRLARINRGNVKQLGLAWFADYDTNLRQDGTPLYIDGVIYVSTAWSKVYAFDARSGKQLWQYDPKTPGEWIRNVCCGIVNRGIAAWNGKIYLGTLDGRLVAVDAHNGKEVWSTLTIDKSKHYSITSAPRVVKGKVLIGESGSEYGVRGYLSAYDAETGKLAWRFYTVPGNPKDGFENEAMKRAAATWSGEGWKLGGGGTVWDAILYDAKTDLVFFGTGNGSPWNDRYRDPNSGDNLYLATILALKLSTGEYAWHYQTTPADTWDYDAVSPMVIADLTVDGQQHRVLMQACKNGFFYMLDTATGKLLRATPFTEVNWANGIDMKTGRPRLIEASRFPVGKPFNLAPGVQGAHGWQGNAFSPATGLLYIPTQHAYFPMIADASFTPNPVGYNLGLDFTAPLTYYTAHPQEKSGFTSYLQAWDPVAGKQVWKSEEGGPGGTGGALATGGGLVFQGAGSAPEFRAFDAKTGQKLWSANVQTGMMAPPITYELDGQQYVAASVGGAPAGGYYAPNYSRMLVFAIGGKATLPAAQEYVPPPLNPPPATASAAVVQTGSERYASYCAACHGDRGQTRGANFPDLTRTPLLNSQAGFDQVVLKGVLSERGMASFAEALQPADTAALRAYIIARANELKKNPPPNPLGPPPAQPHQEIGK